jgi:serine/threonine protein kinase
MAKRVASAPPVLPGFTYVRPLGTGGFADVFLYEQDMPRRVVAVKVLLNDAINPDVLRVFNAEADIMARLSAHPSIVTIYQASISSDGRPYLAMEYCPDTMGARYKKTPLGVGEVLDAGVRIAAALETAHRSGVLHRDIKPSNILITSLGGPVLADFGIAAALGADAEEPELVAMSVPWSSPEVLAEKVSGSVASEIWSLGATLYTLLAGRSPFELADRAKNTRDQLSARVAKAHYTPMGRTDVSEKLESILARSMSKDPAKRYESMYAFAEDLRWAQYELGMPPTALEVAAPEWAAAASPVSFADAARRGPVITTVNKDSRRAARAQNVVSRLAEDRDGITAEPARRAGWRIPVIVGVVGILLIGATALALRLVGVI